MKITYPLIAVIAIALTACVNKKTTPAQQDTIPKAHPAKEKFTVTDPSQYSKTFLNKLRTAPLNDTILLVKNYIIIGKDTTIFPDDLALKKEYKFKGSKDSATCILTVTRSNLTDIQFNYSVYIRGRFLNMEASRATLQPMFFLGAEMPEDEESGESYMASEYFTHNKGCIGSITISLGRDDDNNLLATIKPSCKDERLAKFAGITMRSK